jgi:integrase
MAVIKKGDKFYVVIEEGRDPVTGKRRQKWYSGFDKKPDAVAEHERIRTEIRQGTFVKPTKTTLAEYMDKWVESLDIRNSTRDSYKWAIDNYLKPSLGHLQLTSISADNIDDHFTAQRKSMEKAQKKIKEIESSDLSADEKSKQLKKIKPLSPTSIRYQFTVLNMILRKATKMRKIPFNPCDAIDPPQKDKYKPVTLNFDQVITLLSAAKKTNIFLPVLIGITCGLRRGEICGLQWPDIDFDLGSLQVNRSLDWEDSKLTPGPTKSDRSERPIPLPLITKVFLVHEKSHQAELIAEHKGIYENNEYVVAWEDGRPYSPDYLYHKFKKVLKSSGLPDIRIHDLRHSYATLLRDQDVDMETISEMLGHFSASFTHSVYAHPTKHTQNKAAKAIDDLFIELLKKFYQPQEALEKC